MNIWMIGIISMKLYYLKTLLPEFYSHLNMEDIIDADYSHAKRVNEDFKITNLAEYHDLYVQNNTLLLADVFENFRNMCLETQKLDPDRFLTAPGLTWKKILKKDQNKIRFIN